MFSLLADECTQNSDPTQALALRVPSSSAMWRELIVAANRCIDTDPVLSSLVRHFILGATDFGHALAYRIATLFSDGFLDINKGMDLVCKIVMDQPEILESCCADLYAVRRN